MIIIPIYDIGLRKGIQVAFAVGDSRANRRGVQSGLTFLRQAQTALTSIEVLTKQGKTAEFV